MGSKLDGTFELSEAALDRLADEVAKRLASRDSTPTKVSEDETAKPAAKSKPKSKPVTRDSVVKLMMAIHSADNDASVKLVNKYASLFKDVKDEDLPTLAEDAKAWLAEREGK